MIEKTGKVKFQPAAQQEIEARDRQPLNYGDGLHTLEDSSAGVLFLNQSTLRMPESSRLVIDRPSHGAKTALIKLLEGQVYVSSRGIPESIAISTPFADAVALGTEFLISFDREANRTDVTMFDGEVKLVNDVSTNSVRSGQRGIAVPGQPITVRPIIEGKKVIQWWLYYPGILDPAELDSTLAAQPQFADSLKAYRLGDLSGALQNFPGYPTPVESTNEAQRIYLAGLLLAVGAVDRAEVQLSAVNSNAPLAIALRTMIVAVQTDVTRLISSGSVEPRSPMRGGLKDINLTASESLAFSYHHQSTNGLKEALQAARLAITNSPKFGFGWARVAELEFSFGRTRRAREAVQRALEFSPSNAQAHALSGFLLVAENKIREAIAAFDRAIAINSALGNAWLGRGLCQIRQGNTEAGRLDLQTAAILDPTRSLARSYNGKAFGAAGDARRSRKELSYAEKLDPNDPTPWLYSALENWEEYRINAAVRDLEYSIALNDNRALFRSRLLLDQDRAVRGSSLASVYQNAGLTEVSVREAARAVSYDYENYSAHLFLSESFDALRDPTRFNLRYETVWFNELLLANLLSPVGGTSLSQNVSQQEYSRLFDRNRIGLISSTEYRSDGQIRELTSQFGAIGNTGWSLDLDFQHNDGVRPNNQLDRLEWYTTIKQQITPQDSLMLLTKVQDYHSGDNFQYYEPTNARPSFRWDEYQSPIVVGGYHREWSPGMHTLLLGGRLENDQRFTDRQTTQTILDKNQFGQVTGTDFDNLDLNHRSKLTIYTGEAQQIFENERHALLLGGRWQGGEFDTRSRLTNPGFYTNQLPPQPRFQTPPADINSVDDFERLSFYGYETLKLPGHLRATAGLTYEHLRFPSNFRSPPIQAGEETRERLNPKASIVWDLLPQLTFRGVYARSLGGVSLDESYRLEPTQLAGFAQDFRTLIPESIAGSVSAPDHEILGIALDLKLPTRTYLGLDGEFLRSKVSRTVGVFDFPPTFPPSAFSPSGTRQDLDFQERAASVVLNQLLSDEWALGGRYSFIRSKLHSVVPALAQLQTPAEELTRADLHRITFFLLYNHPSGIFTRAEVDWYVQSRSRAFITPDLLEDVPDQNFQQLNFYVGYRFPRHRGDVTLGVLNATGEDYRLNPVNPYAELPRKAVFYARARFRF